MSKPVVVQTSDVQTGVRLKTTLLLPTLNEIEGMRAIMPRVKREWFDQFLVIDGGSTDGTVECGESLGYTVVHQKSKGITGAYQEALEHVTGDIVIAFSPDGNSVPERIPDLIRKMEEGYDMVIVSRYLPGAKSEDDDLVTAFGNWLFTAIINLFFGGHYTDTLVMFRAWRKEVVRALPSNVPHAGLDPILSIRCAKLKLKTAEIPGDEPKRIGSTRKMKPFRNGWHILKLILQEKFLSV